MLETITLTDPINHFVEENGFNHINVNELIFRCNINGVIEPFVIGKLEINKARVAMEVFKPHKVIPTLMALLQPKTIFV